AAEKPELLLLNKIDTPEGEAAADYWLALHPDAIAISARTAMGLVQVAERVSEHVLGTLSQILVRIPSTDGELLAFLERATRVQSRDYEGGDLLMSTIVGRRLLEQI